MAQKINFVTPRGVAAYPYITRAEFEYDAQGVYKTKLTMPEADAAPLVKMIQDAADSEFGAKAKTARLPFKKLEDTGEIEFSTKSKFKPKVVDSTGKMIPDGAIPTIYGGSTLKVAGTIASYSTAGNNGISLQLGGVQIIELSEGSGVSVQFEAEEGGYVAASANDNQASSDGAAYNF